MQHRQEDGKQEEDGRNQVPRHLSVHEAAQYINDRKSMYASIVRNQHWTPKFKDLIMTIEYMQMVQTGAAWLPKTSDIRILNCYDPPPKAEVAKILYDLMVNFHNPELGREWHNAFIVTATRVKKNPPNVPWMLGIISTMNDKNILFAKDYVKPKYDERGQELSDDEDYIEDKNGFFAGLPLAPPKKSKRATVTFVSQEKQWAKQRQRLEKQKEQIERKLHQRQYGRVPSFLNGNQSGRSSQQHHQNNAAMNSFTTAFSLLNTAAINNTGEEQKQAQAPGTMNTTYGPNVIGNEEDFSDRDVVQQSVLHDNTSSANNMSRKKPMPTRKQLKENALLKQAVQQTKTILDEANRSPARDDESKMMISK